MFFFGVFGIGSKEKIIGSSHNIVCPACSRFGSYEVLKSYSYFHFFFISIFKWNTRYFIRTSCCDSYYELDFQVGSRIEHGEKVEITDTDISSRENFFSSLDRCSNCGEVAESRHRFCPNCGHKL